MDLLTYISDMSRRRDLAKRTNSSPDYLWQVATGRRRAGTDLAKAIEAATKKIGPSVVRKSSIRPDVWADSSKPKKAAA